MVNSAESANRQGGTIETGNLPSGLTDRGVGFQAAGFLLTWLVGTTILELFDGSGFWLYQWFEKATTDTYWAVVVPLAFLFDWMRRMFERGKAIREAKKAEIEEQAIQRGMKRGMERGMQQGIERGMQQGIERGMQQGIEQGRQETTERFRALLKQHGITLPPEIDSALFDDPTAKSS